tara:strand:- start:8090 stop:8380 length:291 start_codon:yes stop_codon:yes gene_type:complete
MQITEKDTLLLGLHFGLKPIDVVNVLKAYNNIRLDYTWSNVRNDKCLMIDCLYLYGKKANSNITVKKAFNITQDLYGVGTKPNPNKWLSSHGHLLV